MRIALVCTGYVPPLKYGGTQRVVAWLGAALMRRGHEVTLVAGPGSTLPGARVIPARNGKDVEARLPPDIELTHYHGFYPPQPPRRSLHTLHGNLDERETGLGNWNFLSADHALRHGRKTFVYNGIERTELRYSERPSERYLFLARINRPGKNLTESLRLAKINNLKLDIAGGRHLDLLLRSQVRRERAFQMSLDPRFRFHGMVGGDRKAKLIANAKALLSPIRWDEPFGLSVIEALASGTPVITTPRGAMPELVTADVGFLCATDEEFARAFAEVGAINRRRCREYADERFSIERMTDGYLDLYRRVLDGETLP